MKVAIVGTRGVPARYGGFETLAENLVRADGARERGDRLVVYCSRAPGAPAPANFLDAELVHLRLGANGVQSVLYDAVSMADAVRRGCDVLLVLGVSGAIALPLIRLCSRARVVVNVDGIEWRRQKWSRPARWFLRACEWLAMRCAHAVVADNQAIAERLEASYGVVAEVIEYGGDHAIAAASDGGAVDAGYALALCRIEPENNVAMILAAFAAIGTPLVFVGNWHDSAYGRELRRRYADHDNLELRDPVYDAGELCRLRSGAALYVHGHSAGGTNPSLVEMMHFGVAVLAFDCDFNRVTTEQRASYFANEDELRGLVVTLSDAQRLEQGAELQRIARRRYTWSAIAARYFGLLRRLVVGRVDASVEARAAAETTD